MTEEIPALSTSEVDGLRRVASRLLRDVSAAEDVVQEAWLAARATGDMPESARRGFLTGVVRNLARNELRDRARRLAREQRAARIDVHGTTPSSLAAEQEVHRLLHEGVDSLEEPLASALRGRFFDNRSTAEMAQAGGMSESLIRHRIRTGLAQLRTRLGSTMGDTRTMGLALIGAFDWKGADASGRAAVAVAPVVPWVVGLKWMGAAALAVIAVLASAGGIGGSEPDPVPTSVEGLSGAELKVAVSERPTELPSVPSRQAATIHATEGDGGDSTADQAAGAIDSELSRTGRQLLRVRAVDRAGAPVAGAAVYQRDASGIERAATTGPDGIAELVVPSNLMALKTKSEAEYGLGLLARADSYAESEEYFVSNPSDRAEPVTLHLLGPNQTLRGVVFGSDGRPLGGALVAVDPLVIENGEKREPPFRPGPGGLMQRRLARTGVTDADGRFELRGLTQEAHGLLCTAAGHKPTQVYVGEAGNPEASCEVRMTLGGRVRGLVRDADGEPAVGAWVAVEPLGVAFGSTQRLQVGDDGRFDANHLAGGLVRFRAQLEGVGAAEQEIDVREGATRDVQLDLVAVRAFEVCLQDIDGKPLAGFGVGVRQGSTNWRAKTVATDADGIAMASDYPEGELEVLVFRRGYASPLASHKFVPDVGARMTLVCPREHAALGKLSGSVLVDSKGPPAQSRIRVKAFEQETIRTTPILDAAGRFEMLDLPPGKYEIRLETPSNGMADVATVELDGADWDLGVVDLTPLGTLSVDWGWPSSDVSIYRLAQVYLTDGGSCQALQIIAEGSAPPPKTFDVFEGDYGFVVRSPAGETIEIIRVRARAGFTQVFRIDESDWVPAAFDIELGSAPEQGVQLEVHALSVSIEEDRDLDALSEEELAERLSSDTLVHSLYSGNSREGIHRFGCDVDGKRRWILTAQAESGRRHTFAMPRCVARQSAWHRWTLGESGASLESK